MATGKKQISFDLDTKALKTYYPSGSWKVRSGGIENDFDLGGEELEKKNKRMYCSRILNMI